MTMTEFKYNARIAGALFLAALAANLVGSEWLDSIVDAPDYLVQAFALKGQVVAGALLEILSAAAVAGIPVLLYPVLKRYSRTVALGYLCLRIIEPAITMMIILAALSILSLGQTFAANGGDEASYLLLGSILQAARGWALMLYILVFSVASLLFYGLLFKSRLVPRLFSVWGLAGVVVLAGGAIASMFGVALDPMVYGALLGLNELLLAFWMIVKGFNFDLVAGSGRAGAL